MEIGLVAQLDRLDRHRCRGPYPLHRLALLVLREGGAQDLMTLGQGIERLLHGATIQRATQAQHARQMIGGAVRRQLLQEPQPFLGEGLRRLLRGATCTQRQAMGLVGRFQQSGEIAQFRRLEHRTQRNLQAMGVTQTGNQLGR
ncbi:hypothetical protein D9M68_691200 [compost metagenome]